MDFSRIIQIQNTFYVKISHAYMERLQLKKGSWILIELTEGGLLIKNADGAFKKKEIKG